MALIDRTISLSRTVGFPMRPHWAFKAILGRMSQWRVGQFDLTELTEAQCRDAGIDPVDLEAARVRRADLIKEGPLQPRNGLIVED